MQNKHVAIPIALVVVTLLSGAFLMSSYSYADDSVVDNVNITVPVSCSLEGTGMNSHNANIVNGTYQADIGTTTLKAFCNDEEGFAIYATGYTGNTIGETNSNKLVGTSSNIATGTATSGDTSNWAMKLATSSSATYPITLDNGFGSYSSVPNSYTKVAHRDSGTDVGTNAEGSTLTTTYAAYMSQTQPAGSYSGQVIYTLVHPSSEEPAQPQPATAGCINYFANASTAVGTMGCQSASNNASVTLWASNFKRAGYGFAGWSDAYDYATNNNAHFYGPNQTITAPSDVSTKGLSLYAVWIKSAGTIQNWNGCSSLTKANEATNIFSQSVTALTDERDNNTYAVAKLADGKCWMIENLRLDDTPELTSANTHNPSLPLTNIYDSSTTSNHLSQTSSVIYNVTTAPEGWCRADSSVCDDQSRLRTDNTVLFTNNTSSSYSVSSNVYSYGNYYNWYSATAGHGKYGSSYDSSFVSPGDICPIGWRLPIGGDLGEYAALNTAINGGSTTSSAGLRTYPANFVYSGYVNGASIYSRGSYGMYSCASGRDSDLAHYLVFGGSYASPGTYSSKYDGRAVRCVAGV